MTRLALATVLLTLSPYAVNGFVAGGRPRTAMIAGQAAPSSTARFGLLTAEETRSIMDKSLECAEGECSVEDVEALLGNLQEQQKVLNERLDEVTTMIKSLKKFNESKERPVDEVRETVRAIARIFLMGDKASGNDYPALSKPTGWTGDVGDGSKTAYDVLPPKKWKKTP